MTALEHTVLHSGEMFINNISIYIPRTYNPAKFLNSRETSRVVNTNYQKIKNSNYLKVFPGLRLDFSSRFSSTVVYRIDRELATNPRYDGEKWSGFAGFAENSTIEYKTHDFGISAGIERLSWGFGRTGNLMFSREAMPFTAITLYYRRKLFEFRSISGFLNPIKEELDRTGHDSSYFTGQQRYISAHSLTIYPLNGLSISLREGVIYGGPGRRFELAYSIPILWYHGQQLNSRMDDNTFMSLGADYRFRGRYWVYGELFIDDYQIEKKSRSDNEPNEIAFIIGNEIYDPIIQNTSISLEYARVNNWTYNQAHPHNRYINYNFPIGYPTGPDADWLDYRATWWVSPKIQISYVGNLKRQGEGRIDTPWTWPWMNVDNYSEKFPSGVVEKTMRNGIEVLALNKNGFWGKFGCVFTDIDNVGNSPGRNHSNWELTLNIGYNSPPFSWGF